MGNVSVHSSIRRVPDTSEPHPGETTGRHALGPHVVGQRVVVRHLLPDGRATDVTGPEPPGGDDAVLGGQLHQIGDAPQGPVRVLDSPAAIFHDARAAAVHARTQRAHGRLQVGQHRRGQEEQQPGGVKKLGKKKAMAHGRRWVGGRRP